MCAKRAYLTNCEKSKITLLEECRDIDFKVRQTIVVFVANFIVSKHSGNIAVDVAVAVGVVLIMRLACIKRFCVRYDRIVVEFDVKRLERNNNQ